MHFISERDILKEIRIVMNDAKNQATGSQRFWLRTSSWKSLPSWLDDGSTA